MSIITDIYKVFSLLLILLITQSTIASAESSPIDPIRLEYDKLSHSISITHLPNYSSLTIFTENGSVDYLERTDTISYMFNSQYRILDQLAVTGSLSFRVITRTEYINEDKIKSIRDNKAGFALGVRYDNYSIPFNPSLEFNYTYPNRIWTGLSGCIIRDPLIHTIALHYTSKAKNQSQELSLLQSLAFLANDRTSLRVSLVSLLTDRQLPSISSITFSASYSLDPDKKQNITLNNTLRFLDSGIGLSIGTSYSF